MRIIVFVLCLFCITSCKNQTDLIKDSINESLASNAMSPELKPKVKSLKVIDTVYVGELINEFYKIRFPEYSNKDSVKKVINDMLASYESYGEESNITESDYKLWKFLLSRINKLEKKDPKELEYYAVNSTFEFYNPMVKSKSELTCVFLVDKDLKVLAKMDADEFKVAAAELQKFRKSKYESIIFGLDNL
jgi:hypothetical protein